MAPKLAFLTILLLLWAGGSKAQPLGPWPSLGAGTAHVPLLLAHQLVGLPVVAADGAPAGAVRHLFVETDTGAVRDLALGGAGSLTGEKQIALVPWSAIEAINRDGVRLALTKAGFAAIPRMQEVSLPQGARPEIVADVFDFGILGNSGSSRQPDPTSWTDPPLPKDMPSVPTRTGAATTLAPPPVIAAEALRGIAVAAQSGAPLGTIADVTIDIAHGRLAFVLVAQADGGGQRWLPVPMQSLTPSGAGYSVAREDFWVRQVPRLTGPLPSSVGSEWLQALYATFAAPPYASR